MDEAKEEGLVNSGLIAVPAINMFFPLLVRYPENKFRLLLGDNSFKMTIMTTIIKRMVQVGKSNLPRFTIWFKLCFLTIPQEHNIGRIMETTNTFSANKRGENRIAINSVNLPFLGTRESDHACFQYLLVESEIHQELFQIAFASKSIKPNILAIKKREKSCVTMITPW